MLFLVLLLAVAMAQDSCPKEPFWRHAKCMASVAGIRRPVQVEQTCCKCPADVKQSRRSGLCSVKSRVFLGRRTIVDPRCCFGTFPGQQPSAASIAVPAAVNAVSKLASEVNSEPEVRKVAVEKAADTALEMSKGVSAPKTLENAAEIGAAAAGVAVESVLGEKNPGLFVAAAADGAANVAVPSITPGEPAKEFVQDELAREKIASVAVEKVATEQLVNEGLDVQSVAQGVKSGIKLAAEDVERKALEVAKYADAPSAAQIAANAAGVTAEKLAASKGASSEEARAVGDQAAAAAIGFAAPIDKPVDAASRAAIAAAAAGVASTQVLGEKDPAVFEAVASKAAADEVVPKDPTAENFERKEERREEAAFVGTATVVSQAMEGQLSSRRVEEDAKAAGVVAAAEVRKDAAQELAQAVLGARVQADMELAHAPALSGLSAPVLAANAAADAVANQGASTESAIKAGNKMYAALQGVPAAKDIEQEAQLAAAAGTRAAAERMERLGAPLPVVAKFADSAAAHATAQVVEAEGIAVGAPTEVKSDVAAHEAKIVAKAENMLLGAPSTIVKENSRETLQETREEVAKMEVQLAARHSYSQVHESTNSDRNACIAACASKRDHAVLRCVNRCISKN